MPGSRREFLAYGSVSLLAAAAQMKAQTGDLRPIATRVATGCAAGLQRLSRSRAGSISCHLRGSGKARATGAQ